MEQGKKEVVTVYKPMAEAPIYQEKYDASLEEIKKLKEEIK